MCMGFWKGTLKGWCGQGFRSSMGPQKSGLHVCSSAAGRLGSGSGCPREGSGMCHLHCWATAQTLEFGESQEGSRLPLLRRLCQD